MVRLRTEISDFDLSNPLLAVSDPPESGALPAGSQVVSHASEPSGKDAENQQEPLQHVPAEREAPTRRRLRTRAAPVSRFKTFDDGFDMNAIPRYIPPEDSAESRMSTPLDMGIEQSSKDDDAVPEMNGGSGHPSKRKRSPSEDAVVDGFLPAAAAMKRHKLDIDRERKNKPDDDTEQSAKGGQEAAHKSRTRKEIDIRAAARKRREAEEETAKRDQEVLEANLGDVRVEDLRNLAVVEEMTISVRTDRPAGDVGPTSDRWNEAWNGRKNFKKFRRKGEGAAVSRRPRQNVIVPLIEVRRKNYGIGEAYWSSSADHEDESRHQSSRTGGLSSQTRTQTQTQNQPLTDEPASATTSRLQREAAEIVGAIEMDRPRQTRLAEKTQPGQPSMNKGRGKRPTSSTTAGAAKRQRTIRTKAASDSESDEELRFKFGSGHG